MRLTPRWIPTPLQGMTLSRLRIVSSGKRSEIEFRMLDGTTVTSGVSTKVTFAGLAGVESSFRSLDDIYVELVFTPATETLVALDVAEVDFWLDKEPMPATIDEFCKLSAAFDFRVGFRVVG